MSAASFAKATHKDNPTLNPFDAGTHLARRLNVPQNQRHAWVEEFVQAWIKEVMK